MFLTPLGGGGQRVPGLTGFCLLRPQPLLLFGTMRAVLWDLLLLCLFARARGDCRGDCLRCDRHLYRDSFDVLVSAPPPRTGLGVWGPWGGRQVRGVGGKDER